METKYQRRLNNFICTTDSDDSLASDEWPETECSPQDMQVAIEASLAPPPPQATEEEEPEWPKTE